MKLKVVFVITIAVLIIIAFLYPKDCSKTGGVVFEGSVFKTCTCLGLTLNSQNPLAYTRQCYGIPVSYSCQEWVDGSSNEGGKFYEISCK